MKQEHLRKHVILSIPVLGAVILMLITLLITQLGMSCSEFMSEELSVMVAVVLVLLFTLAYKAWFRPEFKGAYSTGFLKQKQIMRIGIVFLFIDLITILVKIPRLGFVMPGLSVFSLALATAVIEEIMNRFMPISISMRFCRSKMSIMVLLILTALVFSGMHLFNLDGGATLELTIAQMVETFAVGLFLGALYLRTGSILPSMILHFLNNFVNGMIAEQTSGILNFSATIGDYIGSAVLVVTQIVMTVILLRGHMDEIIQLWRTIWVLPEDARR